MLSLATSFQYFGAPSKTPPPACKSASWTSSADRRSWQHHLLLLPSACSNSGTVCSTKYPRPATLTNVRSSSSSSGGSGSVRGSLIDVLALDVEFVHLAQPQRTPLARSRISIHPVEVCLAAPGGTIAFHSYCHPGEEAVAGARHVGGVPDALWDDAPQLAEVAAQVRAHIEGRRIVGHGLGKDIAALGIEHPRGLQVDTVGCRAFQGPGGQARPLSALAQQLLGRSIQTSAVHSAREDAVATLELYLRFVAGDTAHMDAQALQQHELEQILAYAHTSGS